MKRKRKEVVLTFAREEREIDFVNERKRGPFLVEKGKKGGETFPRRKTEWPRGRKKDKNKKQSSAPSRERKKKKREDSRLFIWKKRRDA